MSENPPRHLRLRHEPDDARLAPAARAHLDLDLEHRRPGAGAMFVRRGEGDYFNVVGLPFQRLRLILAEFG